MKNSEYIMWFAKNKNDTMLHNLSRNWPVMMEASSLHVTWNKKKCLLPPGEKWGCVKQNNSNPLTLYINIIFKIESSQKIGVQLTPMFTLGILDFTPYEKKCFIPISNFY